MGETFFRNTLKAINVDFHVHLQNSAFFQMFFHNLCFMVTFNHALKKQLLYNIEAFTPQNVHLQMYTLSSHGRPVQHHLTCNSSNNKACLGASWSLTQSI